MHLTHPTRVAIDGITASGKSTLARELTTAVEALGRPAIHLTMDGYHFPCQRRYRRGRLSGIGYYEDAYDFDSLLDNVLRPLGAGGDRHYLTRIIDLEADEPLREEPMEAPVDAVVIIDGSFLQRAEIVGHWDHCIFMNTNFPTALARGIAREAEALGGEVKAKEAYERRYHAAARLYVDAVKPEDHAKLVVDNDDPRNPRLRIQRSAL